MENSTETTRAAAQQRQAGVPVSAHSVREKCRLMYINFILFVFCFVCRRLRESHAAVEERASQLSFSSNSGPLVKVSVYNLLG